MVCKLRNELAALLVGLPGSMIIAWDGPSGERGEFNSLF